MNDLIHSLADHAEKSVQFLSNSAESKQRIMMDVFAELIVKECIDTLNRRYQWDGDVHDLQEIKKCIERIQTRFGVI